MQAYPGLRLLFLLLNFDFLAQLDLQRSVLRVLTGAEGNVRVCVLFVEQPLLLALNFLDETHLVEGVILHFLKCLSSLSNFDDLFRDGFHIWLVLDCCITFAGTAFLRVAFVVGLLACFLVFEN